MCGPTDGEQEPVDKLGLVCGSTDGEQEPANQLGLRVCGSTDGETGLEGAWVDLLRAEPVKDEPAKNKSKKQAQKT